MFHFICHVYIYVHMYLHLPTVGSCPPYCERVKIEILEVYK